MNNRSTTNKNYFLIQTVELRETETPAANTGLAKVAVQCSAEAFVVNQSLVLRINICGKKRQLLVAANRCATILKEVIFPLIDNK